MILENRMKKILELSRGMALICFLNILLCSFAFAVPGDFDGDGTADLSVGLVNKAASSTAWLTRLTNGSQPLFWNFPVPADAFVNGRFYVNDPKYYPGVIYVRSANLPLEWYIKNSAQADVFLQFGSPGDTITNLGDWDGDGRDDISVVRKGSDGFLRWFVAQSATAELKEYLFGISGDRVGLSDVNNDGKVELVALRSNFTWYVASPGQQNVQGVQWGLWGDIPLLPRDLDGDNLADFIISRKIGNSQVAFIRYGNGQTANVNLGTNTSIPMVGNFRGSSPQFAWSQRDTGWTAIRENENDLSIFRHGIQSNVIIRPNGTVVQPTSDDSFGGSTPTGGDSPVVSGPGCTASPGTATDFSDGSGRGALWKPVSEGVSNSAAVILLPISYCGASITAKGADGSPVSGIQRTKCGGNGNRAHFWLAKTASQLSSSAPLTIEIIKSGVTECRSVPNPRSRYD